MNTNWNLRLRLLKSFGKMFNVVLNRLRTVIFSQGFMQLDFLLPPVNRPLLVISKKAGLRNPAFAWLLRMGVPLPVSTLLFSGVFRERPLSTLKQLKRKTTFFCPLLVCSRQNVWDRESGLQSLSWLNIFVVHSCYRCDHWKFKVLYVKHQKHGDKIQLKTVVESQENRKWKQAKENWHLYNRRIKWQGSVRNV